MVMQFNMQIRIFRVLADEFHVRILSSMTLIRPIFQVGPIFRFPDNKGRLKESYVIFAA